MLLTKNQVLNLPRPLSLSFFNWLGVGDLCSNTACQIRDSSSALGRKILHDFSCGNFCWRCSYLNSKWVEDDCEWSAFRCEIASAMSLTLVLSHWALMPSGESSKRAQKSLRKALPPQEALQNLLIQWMELVLSDQLSKTGKGSSVKFSVSTATIAAAKSKIVTINSKSLMLTSFLVLLFFRYKTVRRITGSGQKICHKKHRSMEKPPPPRSDASPQAAKVGILLIR